MAFTDQWILGEPPESISEHGWRLFQSTNRYEVEQWSFIVDWEIYERGLVLVYITVLNRGNHYTSVVLHWYPHEPPLDWDC